RQPDACFFFQAEDGIRDFHVTGVQTCALPIFIKHAGYEVVDGSELNGLTLNAVGSGTTVEYVQTYTTQDDGFEMFGGAVDLKYVVGVNVGDDTFDFSEGWTGNIQFALAVHTSGANNCVEAD